MAMPLTERNLLICISCYACVAGRGCRYVRKGIKVKLPSPIHDQTSNIVCTPKRIYVTRGEEVKFITPITRIQGKARRAVSLGKIKNPGKCQECGRKGKVVIHHPDYEHPEIIKFLCRLCHSRQHHEKVGRIVKKFTDLAKARRLKMLEDKYGSEIKDLIANYHDQDDFNCSDIGRMIGISRERVRQFVRQLNGDSQSLRK